MTEANMSQQIIRLQRMRQVREQSRAAAEQVRFAYSLSILKDKERKKRMMKVHKAQKLASQRKKFSGDYKNALIESGNGHRDAEESTAQTLMKLKALEDNVLKKNLIVACRAQRAQEYIGDQRGIVMKEEQQRKMKVLQTKLEYSKQERDGARWIMESRSGNEEIKKNRNVNDTCVQTESDGYSPSLFKRGPVVVRATITRHDIENHGANEAKSSVHGASRGDSTVYSPGNDYCKTNGIVSKDSTISAKKAFKAVLSQLLSNSTSVKRAHEARHVTMRKELTQTFENDLALLYNLDRHGKRVTRVRNFDTILFP